MGVRAAEMTKYAANAMLATKISFMNEIATLCERLVVDVEAVRQGIGSDSRIGYSFIYPGAGYGGSCFPKDVKALLHTAATHGFEMDVLAAVETRNAAQKRRLFEKVTTELGPNLIGKTVAVWGLAFKPGTDDIREAPALVLIEALVGAGATVQAYDPEAMRNVAQTLPAAWLAAGQVKLCDDAYAACAAADALVLVTEWKQFRHPDFARLAATLRGHLIVDGRNQYDPAHVRAQGFTYVGIGR
jgi:UDPglucose 6-dehydrogenase